jgi:hypothetical protein
MVFRVFTLLSSSCDLSLYYQCFIAFRSSSVAAEAGCLPVFFNVWYVQPSVATCPTGLGVHLFGSFAKLPPPPKKRLFVLSVRLSAWNISVFPKSPNGRIFMKFGI